ncbi:hypothetical protein AAFF_G00106800 [Aldrovandia affinis]|uniref:Uncharacterized protein n=1 Tax=Aldrovandia affinis TaxID=143900 RepID=A0AAD7WY06_9TELE|nr:hypothetical protein AAFF_G00106800 [Aldrovandia affinis]
MQPLQSYIDRLTKQLQEEGPAGTARGRRPGIEHFNTPLKPWASALPSPARRSLASRRLHRCSGEEVPTCQIVSLEGEVMTNAFLRQ